MTVRNWPRSSMDLVPRDTPDDGTVALILDSIPCGVLAIDRDRRIRGANEAFIRTLRITDPSCLGGFGGSASGRSPAGEEAYPELPLISEECELAAIARRAFAAGQSVRGRATLPVAGDGGSRDVTIACTAVPITVSAQELVYVLVDHVSEHDGGRAHSGLGMVGQSEPMVELYETIRQVGALRVPVVIQGESGTGKELVARALHRVSPRSHAEMVTLNCGALPNGLLESELFGHVKGAFTNAHRDKRGRFAVADGGTIFLDEIGELSPAMQVKFLRVLQEKTFEPVGSERTVSVDVRVLCASKRDLEREVAAGRFRADLYYRLCVVAIRVPPLRERIDDIPLLASHFLELVAREHPSLESTLTDDALGTLTEHTWPGNVRELENALRYAAIQAKGSPIESRHLPPSLRPTPRRSAGGRPRIELDLQVVRRTLRETDGNRGRAALRLGVSRTTLWRFLRDNPKADADG